MSFFLRIISAFHLLKISIALSSQASLQPSSQTASLLFLPGAWFQCDRASWLSSIRSWSDVVAQCIYMCVHVSVCACTLQVHVYSFLPHFCDGCFAPRVSCARLLPCALCLISTTTARSALVLFEAADSDTYWLPASSSASSSLSSSTAGILDTLTHLKRVC